MLPATLDSPVPLAERSQQTPLTTSVSSGARACRWPAGARSPLTAAAAQGACRTCASAPVPTSPPISTSSYAISPEPLKRTGSAYCTDVRKILRPIPVPPGKTLEINQGRLWAVVRE